MELVHVIGMSFVFGRKMALQQETFAIVSKLRHNKCSVTMKGPALILPWIHSCWLMLRPFLRFVSYTLNIYYVYEVQKINFVCLLASGHFIVGSCRDLSKHCEVVKSFKMCSIFKYREECCQTCSDAIH